MLAEKWFQSRKVVLTLVQWLLLITLPVLYKHLEISNEVLLMVLGSTTAIVAAYSGLNVLQKKFINDQDPPV